MDSRPAGEGSSRPLLEVGRISRPHGLSGEVVVDLVTNRLERVCVGAELTCRSGEGDAGTERRLTVRGSRPFQGRHLVRFDGVDGREDAEALRGAVLLAPAVSDPGALFVHELVGGEVVEADGTRRGRVVALQENPASDLLVLEDGTLVPLRFLVSLDHGVITVEVPTGLFE